jgi:hypothetical protein
LRCQIEIHRSISSARPVASSFLDDHHLPRWSSSSLMNDHQSKTNWFGSSHGTSEGRKGSLGESGKFREGRKGRDLGISAERRQVRCSGLVSPSRVSFWLREGSRIFRRSIRKFLVPTQVCLNLGLSSNFPLSLSLSVSFRSPGCTKALRFSFLPDRCSLHGIVSHITLLFWCESQKNKGNPIVHHGIAYCAVLCCHQYGIGPRRSKGSDFDVEYLPFGLDYWRWSSHFMFVSIWSVVWFCSGIILRTRLKCRTFWQDQEFSLPLSLVLSSAMQFQSGSKRSRFKRNVFLSRWCIFISYDFIAISSMWFKVEDKRVVN